MIRRIFLYLFLILFFAGAFLGMSMIPSVEEQKESELDSVVKEETLKRVQVMEVAPRPFQETILVPGKIEANADVKIAASIPGIVEKVNVKEGDFVKKGEELFQIDLRSRQAMLNEAKAAYDLALKTLQRTEKLLKNGDVTVQEFDEAKSREIQAKAMVNRLQVEVSLGHVNAPRDGVIDQVHVEEGEYVHDGVALALLLDLEPAKISVGIPEKHADAVAGENESVVFIESLTEKREAKIDRLAYSANPQTNTFEATLILDNSDFRLRPGMIVRAEFTTKRTSDALLVPLFSLVKGESGMNLFVEKDGRVEARPVQMGGMKGNLVEITDGLKAQEHIVVSGQRELVDRQEVKVMEIVTEMPQVSSPEVVR